MITILYGTDRLTIDERVTSVRGSVDPAGISTTIFDDAASDIAAVRAACGAVGFFGSGRLVIARDLLTTSTGRGRKAKQTAESDTALDMMTGVPRETSLLVVERTLDPRMEREVRRVVPDVTIERIDVPRGQRLAEWTSERARRYQAVIGQNQARQLLEALFPGNWTAESRRDDVPPDLYRLDTEIAKLSSAAGDEAIITSEYIAILVPGAEAEDFWGITNAIMIGDAGKAIIEVERSLALGSAAEAILGQITSQFEVLAVATLARQKTSFSELASISGFSEARLRQSSRYSSQFPEWRIRSALDQLREIDADAKLGLVELSDALVPLIADLAGGDIRTSRKK